MIPKNQSSLSPSRPSAASRLSQHLTVAALVTIVAVLIGIYASFEMAAVFFSSLGAIMVLAGVFAFFVKPLSAEPSADPLPRLLRSNDESASSSS